MDGVGEEQRRRATAARGLPAVDPNRVVTLARAHARRQLRIRGEQPRGWAERREGAVEDGPEPPREG